MSLSQPSPAHADAGTARVREIAFHWSVSAPTARRILREAGLRDFGLGHWPHHRWRDVWALEGDHYVHPGDWLDWKAPLLIPSRLHDVEPRLSERTWRRHVAEGNIPSIILSDRIIRVRPAVFAKMGHLLSGAGRQ